MARYRIEQDRAAVVIELADVGGKQEELLEAFGECRAGRCSCPTNEYEKLAALDVEAGDEQITLRLRAKPGTAFDSSELAACLDHTVGKVDRERWRRGRRSGEPRCVERAPIAPPGHGRREDGRRAE